MKRLFAVLLLAVAVTGCPTYDEDKRLTGQDGLTPPDQYARYGVEHAQAMALAREFGWALQDDADTPDGQRAAVRHATEYAATLPDVVTVTADTFGYRLTIQFRSGWRTMVTPVQDGKRGAETPNLPQGAGQAAAEG
jgi:hypothetical protein